MLLEMILTGYSEEPIKNPILRLLSFMYDLDRNPGTRSSRNGISDWIMFPAEQKEKKHQLADHRVGIWDATRAGPPDFESTFF